MILEISKVWIALKWVIKMYEIWRTVGPPAPNPNLSMKCSHAKGDYFTADMMLKINMQAH